MFLNRKIKNLLLIVGVLCIGGYGAYKMIYKPHKTITEMPVDFKGETPTLLQEIGKKPEHWTGKIVELEGRISQINENGFMLNKTVYCQKNTNINTSSTPLKTGEHYHIKGRIIGYDDLLEELKLDQVILLK